MHSFVELILHIYCSQQPGLADLLGKLYFIAGVPKNQ